MLKSNPVIMNHMERVKSGIKGLDEMIEGGFPKGSTILVSGGPGSGKSLLSLQFLVNGALLYDEPGVYISLEEDIDRIVKNIRASLNWPIEELIKKKKLYLVRSEMYEFEKFKSLIEDSVDKIGAARLVIDPITVISLFFEKPIEIRRSLLDLDRLLKKLKCTSLITCEIPEGKKAISSFGVEEFTCDGIIILYYLIGSYPRAISIRKMRATNHDISIYPFEITKAGLVVYLGEKIWEKK
jgi:KaiC/GvpD/RAD55 family RecA-like ATPase